MGNSVQSRFEAPIRLVRVMPPLLVVTRLYPDRDHRPTMMRLLSLGDRCHILGLMVAEALLQRCKAHGVCITEEDTWLLSNSLGGADNFTVASHADNMRYRQREQAMVEFIHRPWSTGMHKLSLCVELAKTIQKYHGNPVRLFLKCLPSAKAKKMSILLYECLGVQPTNKVAEYGSIIRHP